LSGTPSGVIIGNEEKKERRKRKKKKSLAILAFMSQERDGGV
jgi:hypothetical protein